jgi:hypothetical protein
MDDMLSDPNASYLARKFQHYNGWNFAVKTGTTNDSFDGLMASWSTQYTAVTWVGYHTRNKAMTGFMENMTTPIIRDWMQGAHDMLGIKPVNWTRPSDIKVLPAFVVTTHVGASSREPSPSTDIFPSWYNPPKSGGNDQAIDLVSGKLATPCTPPLAKKSGADNGQNNFSADVFMGATNNSTSPQQTSGAVDDVHSCNDAQPSLTLTPPGDPNNPSCHDQTDCTFTIAVSSGKYPLMGGTYTAEPAGTASILVNGQVVKTVPIDSPDVWNYSFDYAPTDNNPITVEVQVADSVLYSASKSVNVDIN